MFLTRTSGSSTTWIHWAKVFGILGVVAVHLTGHNAVAEGARGTTGGRFAIVVNVFSLYAVPLFVMVSGALLLDPKRQSSDGEFLEKRALRLVPALLFWHAFYYLFRVYYLDASSLSPRDYLVLTLNGRAFQGLYYFWIIFGLVLITPVIRPWVAQTRRRHVALAGVGFALMPVLTVSTHQFRGAGAVWIETPWTWWFFYLGFYLLGWALRDVVIGRAATAAALVGCAAITYVIADNWLADDPSGWALKFFGKSYWHFGTLMLSVLLFLAIHALLAPARPLHRLTAGRPLKFAETVGGATLGIFALHTAIWWWLVDLPLLGQDRLSTSILMIIARYSVVIVVTTSIVLGMQRVPVLRRVV